MFSESEFCDSSWPEQFETLQDSAHDFKRRFIKHCSHVCTELTLSNSRHQAYKVRTSKDDIALGGLSTADQNNAQIAANKMIAKIVTAIMTRLADKYIHIHSY